MKPPFIDRSSPDTTVDRATGDSPDRTWVRRWLPDLRRLFVGGGAPQSEDIQRRLLVWVADHGEARLEHLESTIMNDMPEHLRRHHLLQAGQILVNQGRLVALNADGAPVDPVYATGPVRFLPVPVRDR